MIGVTSSRNYKPGDFIYSEEPFAKVLPRQLKNVACESCSKTSYSLKVCMQCRAVKYCGKECQTNDWKFHKLECLHLKNLPRRLLEGNGMIDFCRIVGQIIVKVKGKDWKNIKKRVMGIDFSFDDIDSHQEIMESHRMNFFYKELKELLTIFIGEENMCEDAELMKIVGKVIDNIIIRQTWHFYIGVSKFKVECIPNADLVLVGKISRMWAIKKINRGIDKITVPSRPIFKWVRTESEFLRFPCQCSDCSLPYGESVLTKILDDKKAYSVIRETEMFLDAIVSPVTGGIRDPFLRISQLRETADKLLKSQEGVLGRSNLLRLRLLGFLCFEMGGHPLINRKPLLELENSMRELFGEHYSEMLLIYDALAKMYMQLGNPIGAAQNIVRAEAIISKISSLFGER